MLKELEPAETDGSGKAEGQDMQTDDHREEDGHCPRPYKEGLASHGFHEEHVVCMDRD